MAEWLRRGLQILARRFDSGSGLHFSEQARQIDSYALIKTFHILSGTVLFGTGLGIAFFFWSARQADDKARLFAARTTIRADFLFTLPAVILQPLTGAWLIQLGGLDFRASWLWLSILLYCVAGLCWLPVVWLQIAMKRMLERSASGGVLDREHYERLRRRWFLLGWPAFMALVVVFWLMVSKPNW